MGLDRHIVRSMAALILGIIAYVAPSAVQAHEGHIHCGHHGRAVPGPPTASPSGANLGRPTPSRLAEVPLALLAAPRLVAKADRSSTSLRALDADRGCCPDGCKRGCCGTMVCCTFGIIDGPASLTIPVSRAAVLIPHDVAGRVGIGPEALRKPPRTLA
jgi:hypothetical protein